MLRSKVIKFSTWFSIVCLFFCVWGGNLLSTKAEESSDSDKPKVLVSQFMYDPPGNDNGKEYIVIKNYEDSPVDISGYMIGDGIHEGKGEGMAEFPEGTTIEPKEELYIAQSGLIFKEVYGAKPDFEFPWIGKQKLEDDPDVPNLDDAGWSSGAVRLGNNGDEILLMDSDENIVDFVPYIKDVTYRDKDYDAVTERADNNGDSIHRVDATSNPSTDFKADKRKLPDEKTKPIPKSDELLITEVMYTPNFDEESGEYVEITNITNEPIDISDYYFGDKVVEGGNGGEAMYNFPKDTVIEPYEPMIIAKRSKGIEHLYDVRADFEMEDTDSDVPKLEPNSDWGDGKYMLANPGDEILLLDEDKNVKDAVAYRDGLFRGLNTHPGVRHQGYSLERISKKDTKNIAKDFVEQPNPTPGKLLFGPNGNTDLIPKPDYKDKDDILQVNEPDTDLASKPTVIDAENKIPESLPSNIPSFLMEVDIDDDDTIVASNRDESLGTALDHIKGNMLPVLEINEKQLIKPVHQILDNKNMTDVIIVSEDPNIVKDMREFNDRYQGAVRFGEESLDESNRENIIKSVHRSSGSIAMIDHQALSQEDVRYFRNRAVTVWGYGAQTEKVAHQLISYGVDGIESNKNSAVTKALGEYETDSIHQQPVMFAHKGMLSLAPGNTMAAFKLAVEHGIDGIETDIHETKDGELVLIHDDYVEPTTDGEGKVSDLTLKELKDLTVDDSTGDYPDEEIPTLEELLKYTQDKDIVLNLELKGESNFEKKVMNLVKDYDASIVLWTHLG